MLRELSALRNGEPIRKSPATGAAIGVRWQPPAQAPELVVD
jgi:hypothetical protein